MSSFASRALETIQVQSHDKWVTPDFPRIEKVVDFIRQRRLSPGRLLDVGYCSGSFADYLRPVGWKCTGLDICLRTNAPIPVVAGNVTEGLPFKSDSFKLVVGGELIEHLIDQKSFLVECYRILVPGGLLVLTTPNLTYSLNRLLVLIGREPLFVTAPYHFHFHTRRSLFNLLQDAGFNVLRITASHVLYSRRRHPSGKLFEWLADCFPTWGAHLIAFAIKKIP